VAATEHVADRFFDIAEGRASGMDDVPAVPPAVPTRPARAEPRNR